MEPRVSYALVGLFVIALGSAIVLASLWLAGIGPAGETRPYLVYLEESVAGLTMESAVKFQGVDVGSVREIGLDPEDPGRVRILIDVRAGTPVSAGTVASLATQGITGLVYFIELRGGDPGGPPLSPPEGGGHPVIPSEPSLSARLQREGFAMVRDVGGAIGDLRTTLDQLRGLLADDNRQAVAATLRNAAETSERLSHAAGRLDGYLKRLEPVLEDLAHAVSELPALTGRAAGTLREAGEAAEQVRSAAGRLEGLVAEVGPGLRDLAAEGLPQVAPTLRNLRDLAARLERLAVELEADPGLLIHGRARRPGPGER